MEFISYVIYEPTGFKGWWNFYHAVQENKNLRKQVSFWNKYFDRYWVKQLEKEGVELTMFSLFAPYVRADDVLGKAKYNFDGFDFESNMEQILLDLNEMNDLISKRKADTVEFVTYTTQVAIFEDSDYYYVRNHFNGEWETIAKRSKNTSSIENAVIEALTPYNFSIFTPSVRVRIPGLVDAVEAMSEKCLRCGKHPS